MKKNLSWSSIDWIFTNWWLQYTHNTCGKWLLHLLKNISSECILRLFCNIDICPCRPSDNITEWPSLTSLLSRSLCDLHIFDKTSTYIHSELYTDTLIGVRLLWTWYLLVYTITNSLLMYVDLLIKEWRSLPRNYDVSIFNNNGKINILLVT